MRHALFALLIGSGCSFSGGGSGDADGAPAGGDARPDGPGAEFMGITGCPETLDVLACYLLDGNGDDNSGRGHDVTDDTGTAWVPGLAGMAAELEANDRLTVTEGNQTLDARDAVTIEAWIRLDGAPVDDGGRVGIFDKNGQYGLFLTTSGGVACDGGGGITTDPGIVPVDIWIHVACAFDASGWQVFLNGVEVASAAAGNPTLPVGVDRGVEIGSAARYTMGDGQYAGLIDNLVVWDVKRTRAELCETAGLTCQ